MARDDGCDISDLASEWESKDSIREELRDGKLLIEDAPGKGSGLKTTAAYKDVLTPILVRMRDGSRKLPSIDALRAEITAVFELNKRDVDESDVDRVSWLVRKNLGFIKMKCRRQEVSIAACSQTYVLTVVCSGFFHSPPFP